MKYRNVADYVIMDFSGKIMTGALAEDTPMYTRSTRAVDSWVFIDPDHASDLGEKLLI
jgi:hypothetical protein